VGPPRRLHNERAARGAHEPLQGGKGRQRSSALVSVDRRLGGSGPRRELGLSQAACPSGLT